MRRIRQFCWVVANHGQPNSSSSTQNLRGKEEAPRRKTERGRWRRSAVTVTVTVIVIVAVEIIIVLVIVTVIVAILVIVVVVVVVEVVVAAAANSRSKRGATGRPWGSAIPEKFPCHFPGSPQFDSPL